MQNKTIDTISQQVAQDKREQAISDGLSEIYHNDDGQLIDVRKLTIKKKRSWFFWILNFLMYLAVALALLWGANRLLQQGVSTDALSLAMSVEQVSKAGEEFFIIVNYRNDNPVNLADLELHLTLPDNLIYLDSLPQADSNNNTWLIPSLPVGASGQIKLKGKLISPINISNVLQAELRYRSEGLSLEFKKSATLDLMVNDVGLDFDIIHSDSVLVGDKQKLVIKYRARHKFLDNFRLQIVPSDVNNVEFITDVQKPAGIELIKPWVWQVNTLTDQAQELVVYYKVIDKLSDKQKFDLNFSYRLIAYDGAVAEASNSVSSTIQLETVATNTTSSLATVEVSKPIEKFYDIYHQSFELELVKNNINLQLTINGTDQDQAVDFGQTLNYVLTFSNKGDNNLENLSITALLDSDLIDWSTLKDKYRGVVKNNTITWSRDQIPELGVLTRGSTNMIEFSVRLKELGAKSKTDQIKSFAQFQIQSGTDLESLIKTIKAREADSVEVKTAQEIGQALEPALMELTQTNRSNTIISKVNSDFKLGQSLRYFNDDNIPVGAGPLPLEVGRDTSLRVYWNLSNSFHDLDNLQVFVKLPDYVSWQDKSSLSAGMMRFDEASRTVFWELQNMPKTMPELTAEFSININPISQQRNQIIVLLPTAEAHANDTITKSIIRRLASVKTSKLEDDEIVQAMNPVASGGLVK